MKKLKLNELEFTVKSSYRTLALFEFFAEIQRPATVAELSAATQIPQSSTSAILKSLLETSFLSYDRVHRTYEPTMRMAFLSHWVGQKNTNATQIPSILKSLHAQIQETIVLAVRNGIYSQYIIVEHQDDLLGRHVETGSVRPLISSATGWSLLSDDTDYEIGKVIRKTGHEIKDTRWQSKSDIVLERIQNTREKGYAISTGAIAEGAAGIAVNLPTINGPAQAAIAVAGPKGRILEREQEVSRLLKATVADLPDAISLEILGRR